MFNFIIEWNENDEIASTYFDLATGWWDKCEIYINRLQTSATGWWDKCEIYINRLQTSATGWWDRCEIYINRLQTFFLFYEVELLFRLSSINYLQCHHRFASHLEWMLCAFCKGFLLFSQRNVFTFIWKGVSMEELIRRGNEDLQC